MVVTPQPPEAFVDAHERWIVPAEKMRPLLRCLHLDLYLFCSAAPGSSPFTTMFSSQDPFLSCKSKTADWPSKQKVMTREGLGSATMPAPTRMHEHDQRG